MASGWREYKDERGGHAQDVEADARIEGNARPMYILCFAIPLGTPCVRNTSSCVKIYYRPNLFSNPSIELDERLELGSVPELLHVGPILSFRDCDIELTIGYTIQVPV